MSGNYESEIATMKFCRMGAFTFFRLYRTMVYLMLQLKEFCMKDLILTLGIVLPFFFSCNEKSVDLKHDILFSYRFGSCITGENGENILIDSSFVYSFTDSLVIDFSVPANCCPDSDRFDVIYNLLNEDTLVVSVADTAQNLCYCNCSYMIHAVFQELPDNHYVVRCRLNNYKGTHDPIYLVDVDRKM
jgi:hypothetical protein